jgi:DNA recombination protein RmuC
MNDLLILAPSVLALLFAAGFVMAVLALGKARARAEAAEARVEMLHEQQARSGELIRAQAAQSAQTVAEQLVTRAAETFRSQEQLAQARLESQLKPVADTLAKFEAQVTAMEKARAEETGGLKQQIAELLTASTATQDEARKLSAALRRGAGVQGRWGEQMLRNVLEAAGLQSRFDFDEQFSMDTEEGRKRPDVVVRMPGGGVLVIDAKCSLNAFLDAQNLTEEVAREAAYVRHAASVREHVRGLSGKAYWDQFERSPDLVAMFLPGDGYLAAALERHPDLLSEAMNQRVVVVTPTTLFALCKAVAYGWRVEEQSKGADKVVQLGRELYKRIAVMGAHAQGVGKALETAVGKYNQFVGSLESQVMTSARRFEELSVDHEGRQIEEMKPVEVGVRALNKLAVSDDAADQPAALTARAS